MPDVGLGRNILACKEMEKPMFIKTLTASAIAATIATSSIAGGFAPEIIEAPVVIVEPEQSRSTWGIVIPIIAIAALIALAADNDDDEPATAPATE